jgi:cytidine deaminase
MDNDPEIPALLIREATAALSNAHPANPPNLKFGAAVLSADGKVFSASAFWSDTLSLVVHAEHAALVHAAAHGEHTISAIACVSTEDESRKKHCHPCGICKQLLYENSRRSGRDITVYMANLNGDCITKRISELVPFPWP